MLNLLKCLMGDVSPQPNSTDLVTPLDDFQVPNEYDSKEPPPPLALHRIGPKFKSRSVCPPDPCPINNISGTYLIKQTIRKTKKKTKRKTKKASKKRRGRSRKSLNLRRSRKSSSKSVEADAPVKSKVKGGNHVPGPGFYPQQTVGYTSYPVTPVGRHKKVMDWDTTSFCKNQIDANGMNFRGANHFNYPPGKQINAHMTGVGQVNNVPNVPEQVQENKKLRKLMAEGAQDIFLVLDRLKQGFDTTNKVTKSWDNQGVPPPLPMTHTGHPALMHLPHSHHQTSHTGDKNELQQCMHESIRTVAVIALLCLCGINFLPLKTWHGPMALVAIIIIWLRRQDIFRCNPWIRLIDI